MDKYLTEDQISSILDDEADPELLELVARSPENAARLEQARQMEHKLRVSLYRCNCPTSQQLNDYHMQLIDSGETQDIAHHLNTCVVCRREIASLRSFLDQGKPARVPEIRTRLAGWLKAIMPQPIMPDPTMAMRGEQSTSQVFDANGITVVVDTRPAGGDQVELIGQVATDDVDAWIGALVEIRQHSAIVMVTTVDDIGGFSCAPLAADKTELCITPQNDTPILIPEIDLIS